MRKLTAGAVAIGLAALVPGCSGAGGAKPGPTVSVTQAKTSTATVKATVSSTAAIRKATATRARTVTYPTAAQAVQASCRAFDRFSVDLARLTPHGSRVTLIDDAGAVLAPLIHTPATLTGAAWKLYNDAGDLVEHVGSSSWPSTGTPLDPQILAVQDDCANS